MVPKPRRSSPCQREAAHTQASGQMPAMSWRVSGRTRDPCSWWKHSRNKHISNSCLSHGRVGNTGPWFLLKLLSRSLPCTPGSNTSRRRALPWRKGERWRDGRARRVKFLTPWGCTVQGSLAGKGNLRPKTKEKKSGGRKEREQVSARSFRTWVLESSCLGLISGALFLLLSCCPRKVIQTLQASAVPSPKWG